MPLVASRKDEKARRREERQQREREAAAKAQRRRRLRRALLAAGVAGAVGVVALAVLGLGGGSAAGWPAGSVPQRKLSDLGPAAKAAGCKLERPKDEGAGHTTGRVSYRSEPPTSGAHDPTPASDRSSLRAVAARHVVHAMEHGRVVFWFRPNAPSGVRGALKKLYDEDHALELLTPDALPMPYEVAATAWGRLLGCPTYNDRVPDALRAFRDAYRLKGPEYVPNPE